MESLKGFVTGIFARWLLKLTAGYLLAVGVGKSDLETVAFAIASFVVGAAISIIQHKRAVNELPPGF